MLTFHESCNYRPSMCLCSKVVQVALGTPCMHCHKQGLFQKVTRGGEPHIQEILGGNMKTHVAVYEESLFDLTGP